jgi:hypothetical protein
MISYFKENCTTQKRRPGWLDLADSAGLMY